MIFAEIKKGIQDGSLFLVGTTILNKEQYSAYINATTESDYFDMLQGVRKVLL